MPCFTIPIHESNDCHNPAGSPVGGRFCSAPGVAPAEGRGPLGIYPRPVDSVKIPAYLKDDVARAMRAGFVTYHQQQPEPIKDITGQIQDPLAMSHARGSEEQFKDVGTGMWVKARGKIRLMTRGGEFEPTYQTYSSQGFPTGYKKKELTPADLPPEAQASPLDVISTFRHEVGHLIDDAWSSRATKSTPVTLGRELRAWIYAMEISPDHTLSEKMMRSGLTSHAYFEFRKKELWEARGNPRMNSWDREEWMEREVRAEMKDGMMHAATLAKAEAFATRGIRAIQNYGKVLKRKGLVRIPQPRDPFFPERNRLLVTPGPGGRPGVI